MATHRPGDKVQIKYLRKKSEKTVTLTLRNAQGTTTAVESISDDDLGVSLAPLTDEQKKELALSYGLVVKAIRDGKMKEAGVQKGIIIMQVNDKRMTSTEDFYDAVKAANMSSDRVLWIRAKTQSGLNRSYTVELGDPKAKK